MAHRIRIVEHVPPVTFAVQLEQRARSLLTNKADDRLTGTSAISIGIRRELAMVLDHLGRLRFLHQGLRRNLLQHECYLLTEILQREPRGSQVYHDERLPERDRLRDRLREIDRERRHLAMVEEEQQRALSDRLLAVTNRLAFLAP
jgi:hypothetical protein